MIMNKILVDGEVFILSSQDCFCEVNGNSKIYILPNINNYNLSIVLNDNANLEMYIFTNNSRENSINITSKNNTSLKVIHTFDIKDDYSFNFKNKISGDNNISDVLIKGVSRGLVKLNIDGDIDDSTNDNELDERIKVLTRGGKVICSPILQVRTKNVIANHGNSISNIDKSALFYLESKGISEENAIRLIEDSYLYGPFKDNEKFKNMIK